MNARNIILYPKIKSNIKIDNYRSFPFSYDYLIQCYCRLKYRRNHETLDGEINANFYLILLMFLKFYKNYDFSFTDFDMKFELPFTDEKDITEDVNELNEKTEVLQKLLSEVLKKSFHKDGNINHNLFKSCQITMKI